MPAGFPPSPVYPQAIDSNYTLYLVYNTTEAMLVVDNQPWSEEIEITPVHPGHDEVWAANGFATVGGELLYYDAVGTTTDGRVNTLRRCARNLGGVRTRYNVAGDTIRSFVIAEHHNQMAQCLLNVQDFVGVNFDDRLLTLDYRIRHLQATPVIWDDFSCPDVTLFFDIVSSDPATGTVAKYNVQIQGSYNTYRLDFGDGISTTSSHSGTHTYAPNATIDPVVTVGNDQCTITETNIERINQGEPTATKPDTPFTIPIPEFPVPPPFIFPAINLPKPDIVFPPIVFPCIDIAPFPGISINIGPIDIQVPSVITFGPLNIPSIITITPLVIPSVIDITPIFIPSVISFGPSPFFSPIGFGHAPFISPIGFGPTPSISPIDIDITVLIDGRGIPSCLSMCASPSMIGVDWGSPPTLNVAFVHQLGAQSKRYSQEDLDMMRELGDDYMDFFPQGDAFQVQYGSLGIPSEIAIVPPKFPDIHIRHDLPSEIKIVEGNYDLNGTIRIVQPDIAIPTEIHVINSLPSSIMLVSDVPSVIRVDHDIPNRIVVESLSRIPDTIRIEHDIPDQIRVVGCPETIELVFPQDKIKLTIDDNLEVPLVYRGSPIEMKIEMPKFFTVDPDEDDGYPRVKIVPAPCPKR